MIKGEGFVRFRGVVFLSLSFLLLLMAATNVRAQCPRLVWSDEFSGTQLDTTKWEAQIGDGCDIGICGWGNNELEWYQAANATLANGLLSITAKKERVRASQYTSARLRTKFLADFTYGRFEARIKLPDGQGLWPAFWMLPTDEVYGGWPLSGEIDIMESRGQAPQVAYGTIHFGDLSPNNRSTGAAFWNRPAKLSDGFHVFAIEWEPGVIRWYVDDTLYSTKTTSDLRGYHWPYDQRFHFLLNLAVGGAFVGNPDTTIFPRSMQVDYVRVYDKSQPSLSGSYSVPASATNVVYSVNNESGTGSSYTWSVPAGAAIVSGQGTRSITVNWGSAGGDVAVQLSNSCATTTLRMPVFVEPAQVQTLVFEDFESNRNVTLTSTSGTLTAVSNPNSSGVNTSAVVGRYVRNSTQKYDTLVYQVNSITNATSYVTGDKSFYLDVYTAAPIGTGITIQLENSAVATGSNYPSGRHSAYTAKTTKQNQWERLKFSLDGRIDGNTLDTQVNQMIVMYDSGWNTGDTYYFDNLSSYATPACVATSVHVERIAVTTVAASGGSKKGQAQVTVKDSCGNPVVGVTVNGTFTGSFTETLSALTGSDGVATLTTTQAKKGTLTFTFCVNSLSHSTLSYNAAANVETCHSF